MMDDQLYSTWARPKQAQVQHHFTQLTPDTVVYVPMPGSNDAGAADCPDPWLPLDAGNCRFNHYFDCAIAYDKEVAILWSMVYLVSDRRLDSRAKSSKCGPGQVSQQECL